MISKRYHGIRKAVRLFSLVAAAFVASLAAFPVAAEKRPLPETIHPAIDYLMRINADSRTSIAPGKLAPLIDFIRADKSPDDRYASTGDALPDPLVYHEFDVRASLVTILRYAFHPAIPSHVLALSSVRHSHWKEVDGRPGALPPNLAERLAPPNTPFVIHGVEHEEITPDLNSGAYYSYDLDRTLIMCRVAGRSIWISLARQMDVSDVGRKGFVLADQAWDYVYSGEKGINRMGLGWVDSYMYEAFSAIVYIQDAGNPQRVRCGIFKWLRAGWNGMNFVRRSHIRGGLERYARTYRNILESPRLPDPDRVAAAATNIRAMSRAQLQDRGRSRLAALESHYGNQDAFPAEWYAESVANGAYLESLTRPQLEAMVFLEYMKRELDRHPDRAREGSVRLAGGEAAP